MNQTIKLDTRKREGKYGEARIAPLRRGERNNALLTVKICANGQPYDLAGKTASLVATTAAGKLVGPCPMQVAEAGIARIMLPAALYSAVGSFSGYVEIREGETLVDTTDSFGGKVIECADLDSEQAAEFTPLLGELQNAVAEEAKRVEAEKARAQAETERETGFAEAKQASQAATEAANDAAADANLAAGTASDAAKSANTAAGKATNAAAKAESDVRAFVNAAGTAVGDAIAAAREDVDAAVKRSDAATANAEDATKTANDANTAATQAVSDAHDAIAEVKATEAKLYPAAENILVGSDSGAVAHVDDAFDGATLRKITVEGACKQDGIPSPDTPKPITVIEHPTVRIVGRNVLDFTFPAYQSVYSSGIAVIPYYAIGEKNQTLPLTTQASSAGFGFVLKLAPGTYTIKSLNAPNKATVNVAGYRTFDDIQYKDKNLWHVAEQSLSRTATFDAVGEQQYVVICFAAEWGDGTNKITYPADFKAVVEYGGTATDYEPYTEQPITFTLPAEHPYLAKLPDGTADEIVVDEEGNVELVARVARRALTTCSVVSDSASQRVEDGTMNYVLSVEMTEDAKVANAAACICTRFKDGGMTKNADTIRRGAGNGLCYIYTSNAAIIGDGTPQHVSEWLAANPTEIMYEVAEPTRYPLGKIDMPKAQDSIVNAWTDAEVTPSTGIKYVRDVNIVVANLESAIASITQG